MSLPLLIGVIVPGLLMVWLTGCRNWLSFRSAICFWFFDWRLRSILFFLIRIRCRFLWFTPVSTKEKLCIINRFCNHRLGLFRSCPLWFRLLDRSILLHLFRRCIFYGKNLLFDFFYFFGTGLGSFFRGHSKLFKNGIYK